jgi:hypothetical protein
MKTKSILLMGTLAIQGLGRLGTGVADEVGVSIEVCVGADRVLRFIENGKSCGAGQQRFALASPSVESTLANAEREKTKPKSEPKSEPAPTTPTSPASPVTTAPVKMQSRVYAPFEVIGTDGTVILRVANKVSSMNGNGARVTIGPGDGGNYAVRVHKNGGPFVAGIGQSIGGPGVVTVADEKGKIVANMNALNKSVNVFNSDEKPVAGLAVDEGRGVVGVFNESTAVAYMTQSSAEDGGNITVALNDGSGVFSAGAAQDGAGEACVNRKTQAGTQRLACLGLGLPSAGMGK